jgi:CCR4-NOT transcription complex subunit 1
MLIAQQPDETLLNVPLALSLIRTDTPLLDWQRLDASISKQLQKKDAAALAFLSTVMERVLFNDHPIALYTDFARSLEAFDTWFKETPTMELGQQLIQKLKSSGLPQGSTGGASHLNKHREQMEYIFEEWVHLCNNTSATDKVVGMFIHQLHDKQILVDSESSCLFFHICIDMSVDRFDYIQSTHGLPIDAYAPIDALAKLIVRLLKHQNEDEAEVKSSRAAYLDSMLSSIVLVINHHHLLHGERFNQKVFHRLFSTLLCELDPVIRFFPGTDQQRGVMLVVGQTLLALNPMNFPGFLFAWMSLISHRYLLPALLDDGGEAGGELMCRILETLLRYFGELSKPLQLANVTRDLYRGILKVLVVIKHDFPQFITGYHGRLCVAIPFHCPQLRNTVLTAEKKTGSKLPDPLQPGLQMDLVADILELPNVQYDFQAPLKRTGLLDLIDQALNTGPSEDAVAHIAHAIQRRQGHTTIGFVPVNVDLELVDAIVLQVATHAAAKAAHRGGPIYTQASSDAALLNMLIHELGPEARYHFLNGMINQLRYPNAHTHYFSQAILEAFGGDMNDQEESDIRQTIIRIFFERIIAPYPHPWGFLVTVVELMRNEKYMFYDLPFIKASPEVVSTIRAVLGVGL